MTKRALSLEKFSAIAQDHWEGSERDSLVIAALGLAGEAGEAVEHIKKLFASNQPIGEEFILEMGDVLYYWVILLNLCNISPREVIDAHISKQERRGRR